MKEIEMDSMYRKKKQTRNQKLGKNLERGSNTLSQQKKQKSQFRT